MRNGVICQHKCTEEGNLALGFFLLYVLNCFVLTYIFHFVYLFIPPLQIHSCLYTLLRQGSNEAIT